MIACMNPAGHEVARGITNYSSSRRAAKACCQSV
ncbi:hypothetical protein [Caballeronia sp. M23-90]